MPEEKPSIEDRLALAAKLSVLVEKQRTRRLFNEDLGNIRLDFELMEPHENYGRMVRITATRESNGEFLGHAQRITADECIPNAISIGGVMVKEPFRRKCIATALYDETEILASKISAKLVPSDLLSDDAKAFWAARYRSRIFTRQA
jgi:hypothetical protein